MALMRTRGVEAWYIDGDAVQYGFALRNACPLDILLKDPVVRNGMCEVHWNWVYWCHDGSGMNSEDSGLTLKYKSPPKNKPIIPASVTGTIDYNGFTGKIVSLESREKKQGDDCRRNWHMSIMWMVEDEDLGDEPTLELGLAEDSNGYPYIYVGFNLEEHGGHGVIPLHLVGKRNTGVLTTQERLDLGLLLPGRTFLHHMSVKYGRVFEYDLQFDSSRYKMSYKGDSEEEDQGEDGLSAKVEESTRQVQQSPNQASRVIRTQGVESWFIEGTRIGYGFALRDVLSLTTLLKNAKRNGQEAEAKWNWVYARTDHTILKGDELGGGLTLKFKIPERGQEINPETVTGNLSYDHYVGGNFTKLAVGRGRNGQRTWSVNINWGYENDELGSTAIEIGAVEDENNYPFIYLGFNLDEWSPLHLIGKRTIEPEDKTLTEQERQKLGLKMSVEQFLQYASKRTGKKYEYDSDLDDVVSLYDNESDENEDGDVEMEMEVEVEEMNESTVVLKKRKAGDADGPQADLSAPSSKRRR